MSSSKLTCPEHGPFGPARFCCACTRKSLEAEVERLREATVRAVAAYLNDYSTDWEEGEDDWRAEAEEILRPAWEAPDAR